MMTQEDDDRASKHASIRSSVARASSTDPKSEADACPSRPPALCQDPGADLRSRVSLVGESGVHGEKQDTICTAVVAFDKWLRVPGLNAWPGWYRDVTQDFFSCVIGIHQWSMVWTLNIENRRRASVGPGNFKLNRTGVLTTVEACLLIFPPLHEPRGEELPCTGLDGERSGNLQGSKTCRSLHSSQYRGLLASCRPSIGMCGEAVALVARNVAATCAMIADL